MHTTGFPLWLRIIVGVAAVLFLWWRISKKWDRASVYSDNMAAEEEEQKKWYEQAKADARVLQFKKELAGRYPIVEGTEAGGESYVIKYIIFTDKGTALSPNSGAQFISIYLKGKDTLIVSKNLTTNEIIESKVSSINFNLSLPEWVKRRF